MFRGEDESVNEKIDDIGGEGADECGTEGEEISKLEQTQE